MSVQEILTHTGNGSYPHDIKVAGAYPESWLTAVWKPREGSWLSSSLMYLQGARVETHPPQICECLFQLRSPIVQNTLGHMQGISFMLPMVRLNTQILSQFRSILSSLSVILPRNVECIFQLHVRKCGWCGVNLHMCSKAERWSQYSTTLKPTQQLLYIHHLWVRAAKIVQYRNLTFRKAQKRAGAFAQQLCWEVALLFKSGTSGGKYTRHVASDGEVPIGKTQCNLQQVLSLSVVPHALTCHFCPLPKCVAICNRFCLSEALIDFSLLPHVLCMLQGVQLVTFFANML